MNEKIKLATLWLDGCSGCHMSLLDTDSFLIQLAEHVELVYSPLVDAKTLPPGIDIAIVEGAVSSYEDVEKIRHVRECARILVAIGDCAATGNVPTMRNRFAVQQVVQRAYHDHATANRQMTPTAGVVQLLDRVRPVHEVVPVEVFIPGCPPNARVIRYVLEELLAGRMPEPSKYSHFG